MIKVCVVTGTRAEYGILRPLLKRMSDDEDIELQLLVTGSHLSNLYGNTVEEIINDGYNITARIDILSNNETDIGVIKTMSNAMTGFSKCFSEIKPDIVVLLGDRYEIFSVASVAYTMKIPIAHLHGGETTEGVYDEAYRHSITKMSYLHFVATEEYRKRVIQLGENPNRVFNVGSLGVENIKNLKLINKHDLEKDLNFKFNRDVALCTFHPVTLEKNTAKEQFKQLLDALSRFNDLSIIFTKANADTDGKYVNEMIDEFVNNNNNNNKSIAFFSLGVIRYLSCMKYISFVIGNSSSGIIEVPSFKIPTINVGDRQKGRVFAKSILQCEPNSLEIEENIRKALSRDFRKSILNCNNPYEGQDTSLRILNTLKYYVKNDKIEIKKSFYDMEECNE